MVSFPHANTYALNITLQFFEKGRKYPLNVSVILGSSIVIRPRDVDTKDLTLALEELMEDLGEIHEQIPLWYIG